MLLNWNQNPKNPKNPNPQCKKYAIESGIRIRRFFGRIAIPDSSREHFVYLKIGKNMEEGFAMVFGGVSKILIDRHFVYSLGGN